MHTLLPRLRARARARVIIAITPALLLLSLATGCKKMGDMSIPPAEAPTADYGGGYGGDEMAMEEAAGDAVYDFEDDDVDGEVLSPEGANIASRGRSSHGSAFGSFKKERAEAPPEPAAPSKDKPSANNEPSGGKQSGGQAGGGEGEQAEAKPSPQPEKLARQVIYTAAMTLGVFDVDEAMRAAERVLTDAGGYVQSMSRGVLVMRVPAAELRRVMDTYAELGVVESRALQARDVTDEYVDLRSRIRVLRETRDQLVSLLKKAHNVEQALAIRAELDRVNMELERAEARLRVLASLIAYSTLTLTIIERGPHVDTPSSNDPFPWVDGLGVEATEWR
ncbi:MAG: DUF4349 domain-containing protein [Myxococcales bacterium]|nr:DUF4349 domain-containing protein [Myxococcales bacterium]MCB9753192.1 DUF4349 domain-containing protein [Myxococcales bacterium]